MGGKSAPQVGTQHGSDHSAIAAARLASNPPRSEEHTSELQSLTNLVCRLLLEKKKNANSSSYILTSQFPHCPSQSGSRTTPYSPNGAPASTLTEGQKLIMTLTPTWLRSHSVRV